jgi:hypothetical protein
MRQQHMAALEYVIDAEGGLSGRKAAPKSTPEALDIPLGTLTIAP